MKARLSLTIATGTKEVKEGRPRERVRRLNEAIHAMRKDDPYFVELDRRLPDRPSENGWFNQVLKLVEQVARGNGPQNDQFTWFLAQAERLAGPDAPSVDQIQWDRFCGLYGLRPEDFGRVIEIRRESLKLNGIDPRKRKFPIAAAELSTGKQCRVIADAVRMAIAEIDKAGYPERVTLRCE